MQELVIDNELLGLIPPLTEDEFAGLEASILREGCRDAIVLTDIGFVETTIYHSIQSRKNLLHVMR